MAAGLSSAASTPILIVFPEINGPTIQETGPYPQPPLLIATRTFTIPVGEKVVSATISGFWGTSDVFKSTAGVDVLADGILVAQCVKPDAGCYTGDAGPRAWSHTYTEPEMTSLQDGSVTLSAVQTSEQNLRLGITTLIITTAPPPTVPTMSPAGLLAMLLLLGTAGLLALRRRARA